jgi:hypothetical protein
MHLRNTLGTSLCPLAVTVLLAIAAGPAFADPIPAQPIGFLAKNEKSSDPNDFFVIQGPARRGGFVNKIYFNARVRISAKTVKFGSGTSSKPITTEMWIPASISSSTPLATTAWGL